MSKQTEAMKLALEVLEHLQPTALTSFYTIGDRDKAITALREELAKPDFWEGYVPEPVKPAQQQSCYCPNCEALSKELAELKAQQPFGYFKAEPFGWTDCAETDEGAVALYERPPAQRTWVGLSDTETEHLWEISRAAMPRYHTFKTLIEKALRERNT